MNLCKATIKEFDFTVAFYDDVTNKSPDIEEGYRKIALYTGTTECTHTARQLSTGLWTSKLGQEYDIQHGTPQAIEVGVYGCIFCYMK